MPVLDNSQYETFAQKWHETENKSEACREAFPQSSKWKDETIHNYASKISKKIEVLTRYKELKQETADNHGVTVTGLIMELDEIKKIALEAETPQCSAANTAVMSKAKLCGLDKQIIDHTSSDGSMATGRCLDDFYGDSKE